MNVTPADSQDTGRRHPGGNHHCSVAVIGGTGILIEGASGSGKTSLALGLLEAGLARGIKSWLVADDQALLAAGPQGLAASAPESIQGMAEVRGHGIVRVPFEKAAIIQLVARLVDDQLLERMPEPRSISHVGNIQLQEPLPVVDLPCRHEAQGVRILLAVLEDRFGLVSGISMRSNPAEGA